MEDNYAPSNNNGSLIYGQNDDSIEVPEAEDERTASNENLTPETLRKSDCSSNWCTLPSVSILLVSNLLMIIVVFILPVICDIKPGDNFDKDEKCWVEPFSSLIYSHTIYWFCHMIGDQYLKLHHRRGRLRGYLEFYIRTKNIRRSPFYIVSFANAILLLTVTAIHDRCDNSSDPACDRNWGGIEILRGLITLECMIIAFMWVKYIVVVKKFKKDKSPPDLFRQEFREQVVKFKDNEYCRNSNPVVTFPPQSDAVEIVELQSELLVFLCPSLGQEEDRLRDIVTLGRHASNSRTPPHPLS